MRPTEKIDEKIRKEVVTRELNDNELNDVSGGIGGRNGTDKTGDIGLKNYEVQKEEDW